ncbi:unnamed protein product [Moneuplotes crassus]|uniref:Phospholipid scramblase n=1 Tax=Euplotes crassus TaxID=5936 RepID=A0AAD1UTV3_EUPCR|nr:unnamed protein product [Moneuplotes crassus]
MRKSSVRNTYLSSTINKASKTSRDRAKQKYETHERYIIEQEPDWAETLTCGIYSKENRYKIIIHEVVKQQKQLMGVYEKSTRCSRICCCFPRWRAYNGAIFTEDSEPELMYSYEKSFSIPCLGCCRPEIRVYDHDETYLGMIRNKFSCFKMIMEILDVNGNPIYEISGTKCTLGFCFEPLCSTCSPVSYDIKDLRKDGVVLSKVVKHSTGCGMECTTNADRYYLDFSSVMTYEERVCLTVAVHEIDMLWFEKKVPLMC